MDYGAIIQLAMSVIGEMANQGKQQEAQALLNSIRTKFEGIPLPDLKEIQAQQLGKSAYEDIHTDPTLEQNQMDALGQLSDVSKTGLADIDVANMNRIANQVARRQKAGMAGIESDMAARGQAGSGMDYALRAGAASDANQRLSEEGQNAQASALDRRFKAMLGRGEMAGKIRGQSFDEQSKKAEAQDLIARLNAASRDKAQYYNAGLAQQNFNNQMQKTGAIANPTNALAGFKVSQGNDTRNAFGGYGAAAGKAVDSATSTYGSSSGRGGSSSGGYPYQDDQTDEDAGYTRHKINYGDDR
jgi:hypothetical protein